jgi:hypothetical protein
LEAPFHIRYLMLARNEMGTHKPLVASSNLALGTTDHQQGGLFFCLRMRLRPAARDFATSFYD